MKALNSIFGLAILFVISNANAADGVISVKSPLSAKATMDKFEQLAKSKDLTIFARIDHAAGAKKVNKELNPTEVLIFGNPKGGTPLMQCAQTIGIDLPLKALVWKDAQSQVWLSYNDPAYIATRHNAENCPAAKKIGKVLHTLATTTVKQ
ncbi:DUF302 domain-containing protein [Pseudoalteromonas carrageenovora]|uniref:DUF302 domain-containing protein n=1 Tax=Pseudoalteromonas carrageenovora TaxID=227 RepID=UPI0021176508|nr:DUF302 domain-containing protein [Pseudoalteromonas carrageenovora]MCQ8888189.1 DUF302 domain-containing protein [Pseudoalteromonas carrageenovora]MDO6546076.1 DUF302 domain-containing protein [Pseudoalteromonas carrageenovora]MDO6831140.1 DUF302 domain-containing protein [Pseudoalteromonas carrageenovora]